MYKTPLLKGLLRHHHKNRYTSPEIDELLIKVLGSSHSTFTPRPPDAQTPRLRMEKKGPNMKTRANNKNFKSIEKLSRIGQNPTKWCENLSTSSRKMLRTCSKGSPALKPRKNIMKNDCFGVWGVPPPPGPCGLPSSLVA